MILAKCNISELGKYSGKLLSGNEKIFLNIETSVEDSNIAFKEMLENRNVYCVTVTGDKESLKDVPLFKEDGKVFYKTFYPDVEVPDKEGYITLCVLPDGFCDMREVYNLSKKYRGRIRFIGGNLLEIPGISIGRSDAGKEKMSSVFNGVYDAFLEADISEIDNIEVLKSKVSKKALKDLEGVKEEKKSKSGSPKAPKQEKPIKVSFTNLFSSESVDF